MIAELVYFFLPSYFAAILPVLVRKVNFLNTPVDFNKKISSRPLFGKNKTFRGIFFGVLAAVFVSVLQSYLYNSPFFHSLSLIEYSFGLSVKIGFLLGLGAMLGDLIKSFFKRRLGKKEGSDWPPFDQSDFIIGSIIFIYPFMKLSFFQVSISILASMMLHIIFVRLAYLLKLR